MSEKMSDERIMLGYMLSEARRECRSRDVVDLQRIVNSYDSQAEQIELLREALIKVHDKSGEIDIHVIANKALASTKPKPFDNDALINSLIERTGGEV